MSRYITQPDCRAVKEQLLAMTKYEIYKHTYVIASGAFCNAASKGISFDHNLMSSVPYSARLPRS